MLKGINPIISPELLKILAEMGHGDEIVFGDSNFPAASRSQRLVRADGHTITAMLEAILPLFPLDYAVDYTTVLMNYRGETEPKVWNRYREILGRYPDGNKQYLLIPKPDFYERASQAYCVVATSESEAFANLIIRKGCVKK
ncbi:MAG: L-fucose mutarotase [Dysgonamonadaceae bacterium]|jgi:L-fucose mutarotase|nr:L-fucose mutarotase [Dysgonamonadaceae bacterium]